MTVRRRHSLTGTRILVTRAEERNGPLCSLLRARGAAVVHWPAYRIVPGPRRSLRKALTAGERYDWIVFTSANAVRAVAACGRSLPVRVRVAVVGEATAEAVRAEGWPIHLRPRHANGLALARSLIRRGVRGRRVLLPQSERASPELAEALAAAGAHIERVIAYRLEPLRRANGSARRRERSRLDAITFTSPSTIDGLESRLGAGRTRALLAQTPAIVIGATTARALAKRGVRAARQARPTTLEGLVSAVERTLSESRQR
jgi:uroporphyrinogen-III synthase